MSEQVKIARLSAFQAIIVATITMFGTLGAAYLTGFRPAANSNTTTESNMAISTNPSSRPACYLAVTQHANIDIFCRTETKASGVYIYPNQKSDSQPTKCNYTGYKSGSAESFEFHINKGKCSNGRTNTDADLECVVSPISKTLNCTKSYPGDKPAQTVIYEPFSI